MNYRLVRVRGCTGGYGNGTYMVYDHTGRLVGSASYDPLNRMLSMDVVEHGSRIGFNVQPVNAPPPNIMLPNSFTLKRTLLP